MKISVVIPSYNRADLLERTIQSVLKQTYKNFEIIIVDDASVDNTLEVIQSLKEKNSEFEIKYVKHTLNKGESGARNSGIQASNGDYVAFLDSDDEWHETKLEKQINFLTQSSFQYDGVVCEYYQVLYSPEGELLQQEILTFSNDYLTARNILLKGCGYGIGTNLLLKREKITEYFDEHLRLFADLDWLYRILSNCKIGILHEPLSYYHKAPMRTGEHVEQHAKIFMAKYDAIQAKLNFFERKQFHSTIYWYIAVAYNAHNSYRSALHYYILGLVKWPFRNPGNYIYLFNLLFKWLLEK